MTAEPFSTLGIAPTRDVGVVKRAYFGALAKHPPQADPEGFRRIRAAYERLSTPGGLAAAFAASPLDVADLARAYGARFDARLAAASQALAAQRTTGTAVQQFVERFSKCTWEAARRAIGPG